ncbi:MAG: hypothetical protein J6A28_03910 [Clostridia bacterium]|nr:hypothetical protein [Clostridia bacterium]
MKIGEVFYYDENYSAKAEWCNQNDCHIEEVDVDYEGQRRFVIKENDKQSLEEILRYERSEQCFPIINRGKLWYDSLSSAQLQELTSWYQAWLDAPATKIMPSKPKWLI